MYKSKGHKAFSYLNPVLFAVISKFSLLFFTLAFSLPSCAQRKELKSPPPHDHVGDTSFDKELDDPTFRVCNQLQVAQYYNFGKGLQYKGEKAALNSHFKKLFLDLKESESGFITIRFIVNCEGKTGWFRVQEMDVNYKPKKFKKTLLDELVKLTMELDGWVIGEDNGRKFDYYQYLTFKFHNGKLIEIMP